MIRYLILRKKICSILHTNLKSDKKIDLLKESLEEYTLLNILEIQKINDYIKCFITLSQVDISKSYYAFQSTYGDELRYGINVHNTIEIASKFNELLQEKIISPCNKELETIGKD